MTANPMNTRKATRPIEKERREGTCLDGFVGLSEMATNPKPV
jgi:hypothetical protein